MTQERIDTCSELGVAILTRAPPSRDVPFVKRLPATSVRLGAGADDCRGSSGPCGNGDMLERAMLRTNADAAQHQARCAAAGIALYVGTLLHEGF
jgi:hypothetical protein